MTLTRLGLAWLPVAAWFLIATYAISQLVAALPPGVPAAVQRTLLQWRIVEALLLTLFASLWFDSLGSGGWWLVFLLVGALATIPGWLRARDDQPPVRTLIVAACADIARYVLAGAILAWRLG